LLGELFGILLGVPESKAEKGWNHGYSG